jgi:hypothetical protein
MTADLSPVDVRRLNSPGPISDAFLLSRAFICVIIGPVGSAKTVTALRKLRRVAQRQKAKVDAQGRLWRKARCGVIRESYPNIDSNTLPSWFRVHPEDDGKFNWRAPYTHKLTLIQAEDEEGQATDIVDFEMEFRAIGDKSVESVCRGWEVNAVMIDEADLQPPELVSYLSGRVGRFSDLDPSMVVDPQIILSTNAPYIDNWVYKMAVEKDLGSLVSDELKEALGGRPLVETFIQPGGLEPDAENLHNLPGATPGNPRGGRGYYVLQAAANAQRPDYVDRMIHNKFVPVRHGQPVNPQFSYSDHVRPIDWDPRRPLIVGLDQGLYAAATACQRTAMGQLRTLRETVFAAEGGNSLLKIGPTAFGQKVRQMLNDHFPDLRPEMLRVIADPAAFAADDREDNEHDWILACQKALNLGGRDAAKWFIRIRKAKSNKAALRNEAIWRAMSERGGYAVDPSCKLLIRGHLGGYHYKKAELPASAGGEVRGHLVIADTIYTHVCDAEQYAALEGEHVIADIRGTARRDSRTVVNDSAYDILGGY